MEEKKEKKEKENDKERKTRHSRSSSVSDRIGHALKSLASKAKTSPRRSSRGGEDSAHASDAEESPRHPIALDSDAEDGGGGGGTRFGPAVAAPYADDHEASRKKRHPDLRSSHGETTSPRPYPWDTPAGVNSLTNVSLRVDDIGRDLKELKRLVETLSITIPRQIESVQRHLDERDAQIAAVRVTEDEGCSCCSFSSCCCQ
jgi:hypothetical protein